VSDLGLHDAVRAAVQERLLERPLEVDPFAQRLRIRGEVARAVDLRPVADRAALVREITDDIAGLGPLEPLLRDPDVTEVMVNAPDAVWVERAGSLVRTPIVFRGADEIQHLIERIVAPLGLRIDQRAPWVDARLSDGSRVHAIVPPLAVHGPAITIRRAPAEARTIADLTAAGALEPGRATRLVHAVRQRRSILISGGAGAGKTTLLRALAAEIPANERVITVEDTAELRLLRAHLVALEARPANVEGTGEVTIRDLVRNALRMRPDRIVVGEVRGAEVLDMLQAMNTGHRGSMSTVHANSIQDVVARLEAMALIPGGMDPAALRRQITSALDLIVQVGRAADGARTVQEIGELVIAGDRLEVVPWP
jgi:pilus assembly protein CpaF